MRERKELKMRWDRARHLAVVGGNRGSEACVTEYSRSGRRESIPAQRSSLRFCWEKEQEKLIKHVDFSAKKLFLRLVSPEESIKWEGPFQGHVIHLLPHPQPFEF